MTTLLKNITRIGVRDALFWSHYSSRPVEIQEVRRQIQTVDNLMGRSIMRIRPLQYNDLQRQRERFVGILRKLEGV